MRAIGFCGGQYGDVIMGLVAARAHKEQFPDSHLTLGIAEKYSAIAPLFENNPLIDDIHIWKGYNDWPANEDHLAIAQKGFTKVYNAMPQHTSSFWYMRTHQTAELCLMHGLIPPNNLQIDLGTSWHSKTSNYVALSLFGATRGDQKSVSVEQAEKIVELIKGLGLTPIQLGLSTEPQICENRFVGTFVESVSVMLASRLLLTVDTAMAWIASGYSMPVLGLYGYEYYPMARTSKNWQPVNPNAIYIESGSARDIMLERIEAALKTLIN